ncbi:DUF305 domain-containing protein [Mycetocola spongiae]|nr:DUF305 domain-containing protein [Mycetocola spongiae]
MLAWAVGGGALVIALIVVFSLGRLSTLGEPTPGNASAEAGFARDMQEHHDQGVELAMIVRDLTTDPAVRTLAYDIARTQGAQSGMMSGWLAVWGLPQAAPEPAMTWMMRPDNKGMAHDHSGRGAGNAAVTHRPGDPMPGLATPAQIAHLETLTGIEAEREFLELMIAHHRGAVEMADALLDRSTNGVATTLSRGIVSSQESEITLMTEMLAARS